MRVHTSNSIPYTCLCQRLEGIKFQSGCDLHDKNLPLVCADSTITHSLTLGSQSTGSLEVLELFVAFLGGKRGSTDIWSGMVTRCSRKRQPTFVPGDHRNFFCYGIKHHPLLSSISCVPASPALCPARPFSAIGFSRSALRAPLLRFCAFDTLRSTFKPFLSLRQLSLDTLY